ncbi:capsular polysaccharide biosynthesis protein CapC [Petrotoga sp. 9T1HF07.CasAA.8.2]|uniref:CpsB/CapC family capsule biosynthesis tyrosine phosphatase n=1 Tax=Petrotoga sp. 9T1HF07.CasAA.8.2 TaxID=1434329 RepID=UPI000CC72BD4|nr:CpsB/CapC family capsule biosynthesis tyrosine phosphatase [Petrotoga sp. 9T1HF07.CasAA.8.2]PNR88767.1 capsular polysaccharide biosynthesis protein CapC [Petrotoga sp. 9T1HF07.CasAA.8.2]
MYIDINTHLLPNVDNGSQTLEETLRELNNYKQHDITHVIFTLHINHPTIKTDITKIKEKYAELKKTIEYNTGVKTYLASELYLTPQYTEFIPFNDHFVFITLPTQKFPLFLLDSIFQLQLDGYDIVLLQVEKYGWLFEMKEVLHRLREINVHFCLSFNGLNSKAAKYYIKRNWIDFLATNNKASNNEKEFNLNLFKKYSYITEKAFDILNISNVPE